MCYSLLLSTTSDADLERHNTELVRYSPLASGTVGASLLQFHHQWFLGSRSGCSCGFRHLAAESLGLGFATPMDWFPEQAEDLAATLEVIGVIRALVAAGAEVDCVDLWNPGPNREPVACATIEVDLDQVGDPAFRFMEDHRLSFRGREP
jgi:hypothetical protein